MSYTLETPILQVEYRNKPTWKQIVAVYTVGIVLTVALLVAYAVYLPQYIGFETTVLVGIGLTVMGVAQ